VKSPISIFRLVDLLESTKLDGSTVALVDYEKFKELRANRDQEIVNVALDVKTAETVDAQGCALDAGSKSVALDAYTDIERASKARDELDTGLNAGDQGEGDGEGEGATKATVATKATAPHPHIMQPAAATVYRYIGSDYPDFQGIDLKFYSWGYQNLLANVTKPDGTLINCLPIAHLEQVQARAMATAGS
jgi:hypothetical protein